MTRGQCKQRKRPSSQFLTSNRSSHHVALKVLTADAFDEKHPTFELDILHQISTPSESRGSEHILRLIDEFKHQGPNGVHVCLIFKAMGPDLAKYRKLFPNVKLPVPIAKTIAKKLLLALSFLHETHHVIHCGWSFNIISTCSLVLLTVSKI
jgi:serine/threonine-protein kinase SRPK3